MKNLVISIVSLGVRIAGAVIQLGVSWLVVRIYGVDAVSEFFIGLMIVTGLAILAKQGVDVALVQYLPGRNLAPDIQFAVLFKLARKLLLRAALLILLVCLVIFMAGLGAHPMRIILMVATLGGLALSMLFAEYFKAQGLVIRAGFVQFIVAPFIAIAIYSFFYLQGNGQKPDVLIPAEGIWFIAWAIFLGICLMYLYIKKGETTDEISVHINEVIQLGKITLQVNLLGFLIGWMDIGLSAIFYDKTLAGIYSVANKIAMTGTFIAIAVTSVFGRKISAAFRKNATEEIWHIYGDAHKAALIMGLPLILIIGIFSGQIMGFWGKEFVAGGDILLIMVFGQNLLLLFGPANYSLLMISEGNVLKRIYAAGILSMLLFSYILTSLYPGYIYSVAVSTLTGNFLINLLSWLYLKNRII